MPKLWMIKGSGVGAKRQPGVHCHGTILGKYNGTLSRLPSGCCHFCLGGNGTEGAGRSSLSREQLSCCCHGRLPLSLPRRQHFAQCTLKSPISSSTHWWSAPNHPTHQPVCSPGYWSKSLALEAISSLPCDIAQINI